MTCALRERSVEIKTSHNENGRARHSICGEILERTISGSEFVCARRHAYLEAIGQGQELLSVGPCVRGHAPHLSLHEQMFLVVQLWNVAQMDAGERERSAPFQT